MDAILAFFALAICVAPAAIFLDARHWIGIGITLGFAFVISIITALLKRRG
jgi:UPF0716 family protein affecting phage T7 exclusion